MRRILTCLVASWILIFGCGGLGSYSSVIAAEEIKITLGEWSPFMGEKLPHYGVVPHIISEIFEKGGVKVKYGFYPWNRSEQYVKFGEWHATAIWGKTEEREKFYDFSDVVYVGETVLFYHKDHPVNWTGNLEDLEGLTFGIKIGSAPSVFLKEAEKKGLVQLDIGAKTTLISFYKILKKRNHAFDETKAIGLYVMNAHLSPEQIALIGYTETVEQWKYRLMFSKKLKENEGFRRIFNKELHEMKKSGRYDEIWKAFYKGQYNP